MSFDKKATVLVVSAHAADFVWRCSGTIAKYTQRQSKVHVVCLTLGQRGESESLWQDGIRSEEDIVKIRKKEAKEAAKRLGATIEILELKDHPLLYNRDTIEQLARVIRTTKPNIVLTHHATDVNNPDHESAHQLTRWAVRAASVKGVFPKLPALEFPPQIFAFEPDQCSLDQFLPDTYIDVSDVIDLKQSAMEAIASQSADMVERYLDRAAFRASLMRNIPGVKFAEGFVRHHPYEGIEIPI
jgi:4-oxalomesaconate hydratase